MLWWSTRDCTGDRHGRTRGRARYGTCHPGYAVSGRVRKCIQEMGIEEVFGWSKATAGFRKTRHCGLARVNWMQPQNEGERERVLKAASACVAWESSASRLKGDESGQSQPNQKYALMAGRILY